MTRNDVWELVEKPSDYPIIGTKWVFRNKLDENGIVMQSYPAKALARRLQED